MAVSQAASQDLTPVHVFWFGGPLPSWQLRCIASFSACGHPTYFWSYDTVPLPAGIQPRNAADIVPRGLAQAWAHNAQPVHAKQTFANYFRYALIARQGGWWADTDCFCLKALPQAPYVFTAVHDIPTREALRDLPLPAVGGNLANGLFCAPKGAAILRELVAELSEDICQLRCPALFGAWGTIRFTRKVWEHGLYSITPLIGNGWTDHARIYRAPAMDIPDWAHVLHMYHYVHGATPAADPDSLFAQLLTGAPGQMPDKLA